MSEKHYTSEKGTQILIALLKEFGIKKVIASPGTTNMAFVGSVQNDPWFEMYSSVDERSAAYMACGMAAESGEPVVITCTGATASRNYMPGMTEAYYRKLPVIALTYNAGIDKKHHLIAQQIDRSVIPVDVSKMAVTIPRIKDADDAWLANVDINKALLELTHHGGGPVHINISNEYSRDFSVRELPRQRKINRICQGEQFPEIDPNSKVMITIGSHKPFTEEETVAIDTFCASYNAVVLCDHTSGYYGEYSFQSALVGSVANRSLLNIDLLIHLGEVSGDYYRWTGAKQCWRVNPDGEIKDTFRILTNVFEMPEIVFFRHYAENTSKPRRSLLDSCLAEDKEIRESIPELPFGNIWIAQQTANKFPERSTVYLGILNSLRSWNLFTFPKGVTGDSNVGGFGIDGALSTLLGASLASPNKLHFAIVGDLAFFYDMNALGNRYVGKNLRIMLINNGRGTEFTNYSHPGHAFGKDAEPFIAADGHFGHKSNKLVRHYAEDLGFEYLSAYNKESYLKIMGKFLKPEIGDKPILLEVFVDPKDESDAIETILHLRQTDVSGAVSFKSKLKNKAKEIIGEKGIKIIKILKE